MGRTQGTQGPLSPLRERVGVRGAGRRGLTLMELLVVVSILLILAVYTLPRITPSAEARRVREAARQLNVLMSVARNRATEKNRPVGVLLRRHDTLRQAVTTLFLAEVPPPYAGDTLDARLRLTYAGTDTNGLLQFSAAVASGSLNVGLLHVGDTLRLNAQGPWYEIAGPSASADNTITSLPLTLKLDARLNGTPAWISSPSPPLPFQVMRRPVPTMAVPLNLPTTIAVDTWWSGVGVGTDAQAFAPQSGDTQPIIVMFSPGGEVESVWCFYGGAWRRNKPTETLFFLVGKQERMPATLGGASPAEDGLHNWQDTSNFWVTVNPQTGLVRTMEVATGSDYIASRRIAVAGQSKGGD